MSVNKNVNIWKSISAPNLIHKMLNLTAHNWQKWQSTFRTYHCHEIYREEAVGLKKKIQLYLKNYDSCKYVKFGAISLKIDIF